MLFPELERRLIVGLSRPLPGITAQDWLAPRPRREWPPDFNPARIRHAAGLALIYPVDDRASLLLTIRSDTLGRHKGQVSLPGGSVDPGETFVQAAVREAREEVGLDAAVVRVVGNLTSVDIPVSGFRLHPFVALADARPNLHPADGEVARLLEVPVEALMDPAAFAHRTLERGGQSLDVPTFVIDGTEIWGATAMVLGELLAVLGWSGP